MCAFANCGRKVALYRHLAPSNAPATRARCAVLARNHPTGIGRSSVKVGLLTSSTPAHCLLIALGFARVSDTTRPAPASDGVREFSVTVESFRVKPCASAAFDRCRRFRLQPRVPRPATVSRLGHSTASPCGSNEAPSWLAFDQGSEGQIPILRDGRQEIGTGSRRRNARRFNQGR